jgi:hypothetical protein
MMLLNEFCQMLTQLNFKYKGDVLEFGTGPANSTRFLGSSLTDRRVLTFDGFVGLPETKRGIPTNTEWYVGNYAYDYNTIKNQLAFLPNVEVYQRMSWDLIDPKEFNITKISGINIDFDLYEGTIDALHFSDKCEWDSLLVRFDDWGAYPHQVASEVDAHEKAAFYDWIAETNYKYNELVDLTTRANGLQSIFEVTRK